MASHAAGNRRESNNKPGRVQGMDRQRRNKTPRPNSSRVPPRKHNRRVKEVRGSRPRHEPGNRVISRASEDRTGSRRGSRVSRATNQAIKLAASSRGRDKANAVEVTETEGTAATVAVADLTRAGGRRINVAGAWMAVMGTAVHLPGMNFASGRNDWGRWKNYSISLICAARLLAFVIARARCARNSNATAKSPSGISCAASFFSR